MNLPVRKAAIIMCKDDVEGLDRVIKQVKPYVGMILVGYEGFSVSTDPKVKTCKVDVATNGFGATRTHLDEIAKDYQIHVHIDCDEVWDQKLLATMSQYVTKEHPCWRLARCNQPDGHAFPDYQTRLFWYEPGVEWRGKVHETLYRKDARYDQAEFVGTLPFVIVHLPRKKELQRPWWDDTT